MAKRPGLAFANVTVELIEMDDGVRLRTRRSGTSGTGSTPIVLVGGGPGLPDYLAPVAELVDDLTVVHRYDQRGTGGSRWNGAHTVARNVWDLELLLKALGYDKVVLVGHSFGTDLVSFFLLATLTRVAGIVYLAGPFLGDWRHANGAAHLERRSAEQQAGLDDLAANESRFENEEIEFLTLSWFTDHSDRDRALAWAAEAARDLRPVNDPMNAQLNADRRCDPLESNVKQLRSRMPLDVAVIGGEGDTRPAEVLRQVGPQLGCKVVLIPGAGHHPWLEEPGELRAELRKVLMRQLSRFP